MELVDKTDMKKGKMDIREQIWELLLSKGFRESAHSSKILKKEIEITSLAELGDATVIDGEGKLIRMEKLVVKYKFGANNLQKFYGDNKRWSVPFCRLTIKDGKITKKK